MKKQIAILIYCLLTGCGGEGSSLGTLSFSEAKGNLGYIQLHLSDEENNAFGESTTIVNYKIIVEGEEFGTLEETLSKEAAGVFIKGIPAGVGRNIRVEALNAKGQILRRGNLQNLKIEKGEKKGIEMELKAVPLVLNLFDGRPLSNRRLYFHLFSDPRHQILVEADVPLKNRLSGEEAIPTDESGFAKFFPPILSAGDYRFTIRDLQTEEFTSLTLFLWDGTSVDAAPLYAASEIGSRLGQGVVREGNLEIDGGEFFQNIAEALWKTR